MERKLLKNLQAYLATSQDVPVILFDLNTERELPAVILGTETPEIHPLLDANATANGYALIAYRGSSDETNAIAESKAKRVNELLQSPSLYTALNAPLSGTDTRPCSGFTLERLFVTGNSHQDEESSTLVFVNFEAYFANVD